MIKHVSLCLVLFLSTGSLLSGQSSTTQNQVNQAVVVAAAANVSTLAEDLKAAFLAKYPATKVDFTFGSSGNLTTQIQNGAPFQVFLSADVAFPQKVFESGLAISKPVVYATGKLVLLSINPVDFSKGLDVLKDAAVTQFAIASPELAPYGKAAQEALVKLGIWDTVKAKAVFAQTISQAVQFTTGATGIGFINKSALYTKELEQYNKIGINWIEVDTSLHNPIEQAFVVLKTGQDNLTAKAFGDFLSSKEAKAIFVAYGYAVP